MYKKFFKRPFDVGMALCAGLLFAWLFVFIVLIYAVTFQFPVFYTQKRIGLYNRIFTMYKFRTLSQDESLPLLVRRFWLGNVLRFLSLDEMPQLWNVLTGDMSMVGPRPLPEEYLPLMNESQRRRHTVRPGITGLTQVNSRHEVSWPEKFRLDEHYVNSLSFALDMNIIFRTIFLLLAPRKDISLTEEKFKGN
jgi:lipopolysaccharide/colanic/teichoic acid biosynthesis glycosyltransferase